MAGVAGRGNYKEPDSSSVDNVCVDLVLLTASIFSFFSFSIYYSLFWLFASFAESVRESSCAGRHLRRPFSSLATVSKYSVERANTKLKKKRRYSKKKKWREIAPQWRHGRRALGKYETVLFFAAPRMNSYYISRSTRRIAWKCTNSLLPIESTSCCCCCYFPAVNVFYRNHKFTDAVIKIRNWNISWR